MYFRPNRTEYHQVPPRDMSVHKRGAATAGLADTLLRGGQGLPEQGEGSPYCCLKPGPHLSITCTSPVLYLCLNCTTVVPLLCLTCTSPELHLCITCTTTVPPLYLPRTSPCASPAPHLYLPLPSLCLTCTPLYIPLCLTCASPAPHLSPLGLLAAPGRAVAAVCHPDHPRHPVCGGICQTHLRVHGTVPERPDSPAQVR